MTLPIYPDRTVLPGLGYNVKWSPMFFNMPTAAAAGGAEIDLTLANYPLHDFELTYEFLRDWGQGASASLEFKTMMGFFLQPPGGSAKRFAFKNPADYSVHQQLLATGDGVTSTFTLVRTYGARGYEGTEPVGIIDETQPFDMYAGNSDIPLDPSTYSLNTSNPVAQTVSFPFPPAAGLVIKADFSFFYYCKLSDNSLTFEQFMERLWLLNKIKIHSCRAGA